MSLLLAGATAALLWWFFTGAILWAVARADRGGERAHPRTVLAAFPMLPGGLGLLAWSAGPAGPAGAYAAFAGTLLVWGWLELAFLSGVISGPIRTPLPPGCGPSARFIRAWGTIAYHELSLIVALTSVMVATRGAPDNIGTMTFLVLFLARISAKLNLFYGVPNINVEFIPRPAAHLASYFRRRPMNAVFPVSVTLLTFATACFAERAIEAEPGSAAAVGHMLLAALTALALAEHWFMVLPLPDAALWRWMIPHPDTRYPPNTKAVALGGGRD